MPALPNARRVFIEFDGVAMKSKTFCNGQLLGEHAGMFSRFAYDLTPHLKAGRNLIPVFVSMEKIPASALSLGQAVTVNLTASKILTLSKGMFGPLSPDANNRSYDLHGIWQPVKLVVRDAAMIDDAWFIPSLDSARVQVEARSLAGAQSAVLRARWTDVKTGKVFAMTEPVNVQLGEGKVTRELTLRNVQPKLWTPADPNLYRLKVTLESASGKLLDQWTHNAGFRTFEARGNKFYLNGKPYWLRGANQLPYGKNSWDAALPRKLIQLMHDGNQRVTRTHATPWNEAWLDAADEIGLGVSVEGIRPWALAGKIGVTPPAMFAHWLMENEDVVKRGRNHPSILLWTIGNEMLLRDGKNLEKWKQLSEVIKQTRRLEQFRDLRGLTLRAAFFNAQANNEFVAIDVGKIEHLPYYATIRQPVRLRVPEVKEAREPMHLVLRLADAKGEVSRTLDRIEVFAKPVQMAAPMANSRGATLLLGKELRQFVNDARVFQQVSDDLPSNAEAARAVLLIGAGDLLTLSLPKSFQFKCYARTFDQIV